MSREENQREEIDLLESTSKRDDAVKDKIIGDFQIIGEIGRGGMGTVYEAIQISLNRKVALKILPSHLSLSNEAVLKFRREAEAGGRQSHPGIVSIYAVGEDGGIHFIAQELVVGGYSLADRLDELRDEETLAIGYFRETAKLISLVANALQHAHATGVVHRDVKPSNILLTADGRPKVTDFGLAKVEDALALSRTGDFAGTPYYMSPEQAMSHRIEIDHRTDIFSLGVTFYETLALCRPFQGETSHEVLKKIVLLEPTEPRNLNQRIPRDLAVICLKAMEKNPGRRYQTMKEFDEDINRFLQGEMILAKPAGFTAMLWKRIKRNPTLSAAAAVAVLSLVGFVLYILLWSYPQIVIERNKAVDARNDADSQREAALDAKAVAEEEAEKTKAVNEFIKTMLSSPDPTRDGREVKVVDVLDGAVEQIDRSFPEQKEIEATLRKTIGGTYLSLGLLNPALAQFDAALDIRKEILGDEHPDTITSQNDLGVIFQELGRNAEAEELLREVVKARSRLLGEESPGTLKSMNNLANVLEGQGKFSEAKELFHKTFEGRSCILGEEHQDTLTSLFCLAGVCIRLGEYRQAESKLRRVLNTQRRVLGEEHPDTLLSMNDLGVALYYQGRSLEAEGLFREIKDIQKRVLGDEHPETVRSMGNLAMMLQKRREFPEAESLTRRVLEIRTRTLGADHPATLTTMNNLASLLRDTRKYAESESLMRQVAEISLDKLGKEHIDTLRSMNNLADILEIREKLEEAESLQREVLELRNDILGDDHPDTISSMNNLALILRKQKKNDEAEELLRKALEAYSRKLGDAHATTLTAMDNLATLMKETGRAEEALVILTRALENSGEISPQESLIVNRLHCNYGHCLTLLERYDEAETHLLSGCDGFKAALGSEHPTTQRAFIDLVGLYLSWGKPEKATPYQGLILSREK